MIIVCERPVAFISLEMQCLALHAFNPNNSLVTNGSLPAKGCYLRLCSVRTTFERLPVDFDHDRGISVKKT